MNSGFSVMSPGREQLFAVSVKGLWWQAKQTVAKLGPKEIH